MKQITHFIEGMISGLTKAALDQSVGAPLSDSIMGRAPMPKVPGTKNGMKPVAGQAQVPVPIGG